VTTKLFGASVPRSEDARLLVGGGRYLDDLGHDALEVAFVRSPHAHARVLDVDVTGALDVDGLVAVFTYEDLEGPLAEPLPLLIPHPSIVAGRTAYPLANGVVHHVGEAVAMVVARDRYVAEDVCDRIVVEYDVLPAVVGVRAARDGEHLVHPDVPGNVAAHLVQEVGDARAAIEAAPHVLELDLEVERSACMPLEGRGVYARWEADESRLRLWSSTQTTTGVRAAVAAKLELPLSAVDCVAPDVGGGFGVKIMHPWPEEVLVPWAARRLGAEVKWTEDRREHFVSSAHERAQVQHVRVGFDDAGRLLGLDVRFWHDNGAYLPYGVIVPIITSTQLLGPYKPGAYRVEFDSLYTTTVIVTPYRGAGRPQGVYAMERTMDAIADHLGPGPRRGARGELHPAVGDAVRPADDLPGRASAGVRLRRLPGLDGQAQGARRLTRTSRPTARRRGRRGAGSASGSPATSRGPASGRTRAATSRSRRAARSSSPPA
jgi:CO/xanthine dehydrogenase Mo-binding subunit